MIDVRSLTEGKYRLTIEVDLAHDGGDLLAYGPKGFIDRVTVGSDPGDLGAAIVAAERVWSFEDGQVYQHLSDSGQEPATWIARSDGRLLDLIEGRYTDYAGDALGLYDFADPNDDPEYFLQLVKLVPEGGARSFDSRPSETQNGHIKS